jgi:hypothetical protein
MRKAYKVMIILMAALLTVSACVNGYYIFFTPECYLQSPEEIYIMESGILINNLAMRQENDVALQYNFEHEDYAKLILQYQIDQIAGQGSEWERAARLMNTFAPRLRHLSNFDNHIEMSALALLDYSLDHPGHGINCRSKAQILNEMCLALGIFARKVWIMPNSGYDNDCHVVNEIWDTTLNKWVMLDITNNQYWIDGEGTPLSVLEIREKGANREFCTPITYGENPEKPEKLLKKHESEFLYIMKNMVYMQYCEQYTVGESDMIYLLFPENLKTKYEHLISEGSIVRSPME